MPKLLGFQRNVPGSWTAGEPAGSAGQRLSHPTPYRNAAAMPGTYYHPGAHPYTTRLPNGLEVQEAYPGQYYVPHPGMGAFLPLLPYSPILCAVVGAVAGGGAGYGAMKMAKKSPMAGAIGGTLVGGIVGYLICGKAAPAPQAPGPPHFEEQAFPEEYVPEEYVPEEYVPEEQVAAQQPTYQADTQQSITQQQAPSGPSYRQAAPALRTPVMTPYPGGSLFSQLK